MIYMKQLIKQLDSIIKQEVQTYQQLLECLISEKQLLVARKLESFLDNLHKKEELAGKIARLEQTRQQLTLGLASHFQLTVSDLTLRRLCALLDTSDAQRFWTYRMRLKSLIDRFQRHKRENEQLLTASLKMVNEALAFFDNLGMANPTYRPSGDFSSQTQGRLLSERV